MAATTARTGCSREEIAQHSLFDEARPPASDRIPERRGPAAGAAARRHDAMKIVPFALHVPVALWRRAVRRDGWRGRG